MSRRDRLQRDAAGFVTVLTQPPHLCAVAIAGLASALWLNVVAPFAGLVAASGALILANTLAIALGAVLAMLVATAGALLAADWRDEAASRQAWAEIDVATVELLLPDGTVVPNQIDPPYLTATDDETLLAAFRDRPLAPQAPSVKADTAASCEARILGASRTVARTKGTAALSAVEKGPVHRRSAGMFLLRGQLVASSGRARPRVLHVEPALGVVCLVANGETWSDWLACDRRSPTRSPLDGHIADIVVLTGNRSEYRERDHEPSSKNIAEVAAPPNCRGPPTSGGRRSLPTQTLTGEGRSGGSPNVAATSVPRTADPVVRDDLAREVPVCTAELDVIERFLDRAVRDLLASNMTAPDRDKV